MQLTLAPVANGVILVTQGAKNPPEVLIKAKKSLEQVRARILGVVCNNVNLHSSDYNYYYHQYLDYSSYVEDDTTSNTQPPTQKKDPNSLNLNT
jgi:Mrp family chromosome partitioning ATPase